MKVADASGDSEPMDTSYIQGHRFREFHEVLFSVNIALAVIMGLQFRPYDVFLPLFRLEEFFSHQLGPKRSVAPAYLAFFLLVAILTVVTLHSCPT